MGLGFWPWISTRRGVTQFCRISSRPVSLFSLVLEGKLENLRIPAGSFSEKIYSQTNGRPPNLPHPSLFVFSGMGHCWFTDWFFCKNIKNYIPTSGIQWTSSLFPLFHVILLGVGSSQQGCVLRCTWSSTCYLRFYFGFGKLIKYWLKFNVNFVKKYFKYSK